MYETDAELAALEDRLTRSLAGASKHLRSIVGDDRVPSAREVVDRCAGMKVLSVATVTARGEPRISALDGHFLHGTWTFGTSGTSIKARHLESRPAISVAHVDGERFAVFAHGTATRLVPGDPAYAPTLEHWTGYYGSSPMDWGEDVRLYRLEPSWMVAYRMPGKGAEAGAPQ